LKEDILLLNLKVVDLVGIHLHLLPGTEALLSELQNLLAFSVEEVHCFLELEIELWSNLLGILCVNAVVCEDCKYGKT
jgi:hypothetical protein